MELSLANTRRQVVRQSACCGGDQIPTSASAMFPYDFIHTEASLFFFNFIPSASVGHLYNTIHTATTIFLCCLYLDTIL